MRVRVSTFKHHGQLVYRIQRYNMPDMVVCMRMSTAHKIANALANARTSTDVALVYAVYGMIHAPMLPLPEDHCPKCQRRAGYDEPWEENIYPGGATYKFTCPHCNHEESVSV